MKAIQTKYLGPTNTKGSRIKAWAEGVKPMTFAWGYSDDVDDNHKRAATVFANKHGWLLEQRSLASGTLPNGDMCHVLPARRSVPLDKVKLDRLLSAAHKVADIMDHCPDDETAAEAGLELERAAAAIGE